MNVPQVEEVSSSMLHWKGNWWWRRTQCSRNGGFPASLSPVPSLCPLPFECRADLEGMSGPDGRTPSLTGDTGAGDQTQINTEGQRLARGSYRGCPQTSSFHVTSNNYIFLKQKVLSITVVPVMLVLRGISVGSRRTVRTRSRCHQCFLLSVTQPSLCRHIPPCSLDNSCAQKWWASLLAQALGLTTPPTDRSHLPGGSGNTWRDLGQPGQWKTLGTSALCKLT